MTAPERKPKSTRRTRLAVAWLAILTMLGACTAGASPTPSVPSEPPSPSVSPSDPAPTPTEVPAPTPDPTPEPIVATDATFNLLPTDPPPGFASTITCEGEIGPSDPVAIVNLKTGDDSSVTVLRDYADLDEPRTVCTFGQSEHFVSVEDLIDARHILVSVDGVHAVVDLPEVTYHWFALPVEGGGYAPVNAISPDLDAVIWTRQQMDPIQRELVITTAEGTSVVASLPAIEGGRCGSPTDSSFGDYHLGGAHYYALDQLYPSVNALVVASGAQSELELQPSAGGQWEEDQIPLFPIWSPVEEVLYYRLGNDVMRWTPKGGAELFLADTPWFNPSMTSDGERLAYAVDSDLYLLTLASDAGPQLIRENVRYPTFVNGSQIWYQAAPNGGCVGEDVVEMIYDIRDGSEGPSIIEFPQEIWPTTSSNH